MPRRKVNRVGTATLTVSLPSAWARQHGIKPGSEVDVAEEGSKLVISRSAESTAPRHATITLKKGEPFLRRYLNAMYRDGFDQIEIVSEEPLDLAKVKQGSSQLLGFEIVESHPARVVIRNIASPNESEFDNIFRRLFLLNNSIASSLADAMKTASHAHGREIGELEKLTNKSWYFCQRVLLKKDYTDRTTTLIRFCTISLLEQIADHLKRVGVALSAEKKILSKPVVQLFEHLAQLLRQISEVYFRPEPKRITALTRARSALFDNAYALLRKNGLRGTENEIVALIVAILGLVKGIESEMFSVH